MVRIDVVAASATSYIIEAQGLTKGLFNYCLFADAM
jgi:hypothetical protein